MRSPQTVDTGSVVDVPIPKMDDSQFFEDESGDSAFLESQGAGQKPKETKASKGLWSRIQRAPSLGLTFFRKDHSEHQNLLLGEFIFAAVTRAGDSTLSFIVVAALLAYFAIEVNRPGWGVVVFSLGLPASLMRLSIRRRFSNAELSDPVQRRFAHKELIVASLIGSAMWGVAIIGIYPAMQGDMRSVFLLLMVGSVMVGSPAISAGGGAPELSSKDNSPSAGG